MAPIRRSALLVKHALRPSVTLESPLESTIVLGRQQHSGAREPFFNRDGQGQKSDYFIIYVDFTRDVAELKQVIL